MNTTIRKAPPVMTLMKSSVFALATACLWPVSALAGPAMLGQLTLAQDLFAYGVQQQDPILVLGAAKIAAAIPLTDTDRPVQTRPGAGAGAADDSADPDQPLPAMVTAPEMFQTAYELAEGDAALQGMIEDASVETSRGQMGGATRTLNRLQSGYVDMVRVAYEGGKLAELAILGADGANLDLRVTDEKGNTICQEQGASDKLYCAWTPATDGVFFAEVENVSPKRNSYYVLTN